MKGVSIDAGEIVWSVLEPAVGVGLGMEAGLGFPTWPWSIMVVCVGTIVAGALIVLGPASSVEIVLGSTALGVSAAVDGSHGVVELSQSFMGH